MFEQSIMPFYGTFGWLSIMLLVGVVLRAKIGIFQKFLFPASILGGFVGFILMSTGVINISYDQFTLFAIHFFTINFISIGLTGTDAKPEKGTVRKTIFKGMFWMAIVFVAIWCFQGLIGTGVVYITNLFSTDKLFTGLGWLVPSGMAQGPGQAVALATVWETGFKIPNAISFGLTFAAFGFLIASLVGVPLANWGIRKGLTVNAPKELPNELLVGLYDDDKRADAGKLTTHSSNIDGLAFQLAILMTTYFLTYYACLGIKELLPGPVKALAFGLMFMWGMCIALVIRWILGKLGLAKYIDNNVQRRITGVAVDFLIVATLMAVKIAAIWSNLVPIVLMCLLPGMFTFFYLFYFGHRLGEYGFERLVAIFGLCTGTAASGLLLLRIVDPEFKTPVATELGLSNIPVLVTVPLSFITFTLPKFGVGKGIIILAVISIVMMILLKVLRMWKKPVW